MKSSFVEKLTGFRSPILMPWVPSFWNKRSITQLRKLSGEYEWRRCEGGRAKTLLIVKAIFWPLVALLAAPILLYKHGGEGVRIAKRSAQKQLIDILYVIFGYGVSPDDYYERQLYSCDLPKRMPDFISEMELVRLNAAINDDHFSKRLDNKQIFEELARKERLPAVLSLGVYREGSFEVDGDVADIVLPECSLYFKPVASSVGKGIERWDYDAGGEVWSFREFSKNAHELSQHFRDSSLHDVFLLQPVCINHESVADLSTGGLVTMRVMTLLDENNIVQIIGSYLVMPVGSSMLNSWWMGGIVAEVDMQTGVLGVGVGYSPPGMYEKHPETGAFIRGHSLDLLPEVRALVTKAHHLFPEVLSVGWDVAITDDGPKVLEANTLWGMVSPFFNIAETPFPERYLDVMSFKSN